MLIFNFLYLVNAGEVPSAFELGGQESFNDRRDTRLTFFSRKAAYLRIIMEDAEIKVALQTIFHEIKFPSHILLPIIPKEA